MGVGLCIMYLVTNIFVILIMKYTVASNFNYKQGMYMGIHIPLEHKDEPEITEFVENVKKKFNKVQYINILPAIGVSVWCIFDILSSSIALLVWIFGYIMVSEYILMSSHYRLYKLKVSKGWIVENQKKVYIDTNLSQSCGKSSVSMKYHWALIALVIAGYIPIVCITNNDLLFEDMSIYFMISILISVLLYLFNIYVNRSEKDVYSGDSNINKAVSFYNKKYKSYALISMSIFNMTAWLYIVAVYLIHRSLFEGDMILYVTLQLLGSAFMVALLIYARKKKSDILVSDSNAVYIDDDEYWKYGFYCNPNDKRVLIKDRMFETNYSFNLGSKGGLIWTVVLTVALVATIFISIAVIIPFMNVNIKIDATNDYIDVKAASYECNINIDDIEEVQLFEHLPTDRFVRRNGGSTGSYDVGYYEGKSYGKCMLFILSGKSPVIMIRSKDKTVFFNSKEDGVIQELYNKLAIN